MRLLIPPPRTMDLARVELASQNTILQSFYAIGFREPPNIR